MKSNRYRGNCNKVMSMDLKYQRRPYDSFRIWKSGSGYTTGVYLYDITKAFYALKSMVDILYISELISPPSAVQFSIKKCIKYIYFLKSYNQSAIQPN